MRFSWMRLAAAAAISLVALPVLAGAARIGQGDLAKTFGGMRLNGVYPGGQVFSETYEAGGSIRYRDADSRHRGKWSVKNGMFCTFYQGQDGGCFFVERRGGNCFVFYEVKNPDAAAPEPMDDWSARGWNSSEPSTCPTGPEIAV